RPEGFLDRSARGRALESAKQRGRPPVQRRLERSELRPVLIEEVTEVVAEDAHAALGLALVLPPAHAARVDAEAQLAGKDFVGAVEDGRGPATPGDAGLEVIDPDPERHPAVATEELHVPRVPRQLVRTHAHPRKARPAVRQHAHEAVERLLDTTDPAARLEPVVLRLHSGRRLHAPQRPHRRWPVAAPDMPHHALVAPRKAILAGEDLVDLPRLGWPALSRQPHVLQSLEHAVDRFLVAIRRGPLPAPPVRPLALGKLPQPVAERAFPHPELLRHVADRDTALYHALCNHDLLPGQFHARVSAPVVRPGDCPLQTFRQSTVRKTGCPQRGKMACPPTRVETFKLSPDPQLIEKVRDIVGLYLNPPAHAVVFCVDVKPQIQALDRSAPVLPLEAGQAERRTHDYKRHGTTSLYAALNARTGKVIGKTFSRQRAREFRRFLEEIDASVPAALAIHIILDNASPHKSA